MFSTKSSGGSGLFGISGLSIAHSHSTNQGVDSNSL
jgi:hypothetical protein